MAGASARVRNCTALTDIWDQTWAGRDPAARCHHWANDRVWGALRGNKTLDQACSGAWARRQCALQCCLKLEVQRKRAAALAAAAIARTIAARPPSCPVEPEAVAEETSRDSTSSTEPHEASNTCAGERFYVHEMPTLTWPGVSRELEAALNPHLFGRRIPCPGGSVVAGTGRPCLDADEDTYFDARRRRCTSCERRCLNASAALRSGRGPEGLHRRPLDMSAIGGGLDETVRASFWRVGQYQLEHLLFHRIARDCQVSDPERATLFLVPYAPGMFLEAVSRSWGNGLVSHAVAHAYVDRLQMLLGTSRWWRRRNGSDHLLILGRPLGDLMDKRATTGRPGIAGFRQDDPFWRNTIQLSVEAPRLLGHAMAVPWPGVLRPASAAVVRAWQTHALAQRKPVLLTFVGSTRSADGTPRGAQTRVPFAQACNASSECRYEPRLPQGELWALYLRSRFCIHLAGDTLTRRGLFDSSVCGCVPVVADEETANYPVFLPGAFRGWGLVAPTFESAAQQARSMPARELARRRRALIGISAQLVYAEHGGGDAFEHAMANARSESRAHATVHMRSPLSSRCPSRQVRKWKLHVESEAAAQRERIKRVTELAWANSTPCKTRSCRHFRQSHPGLGLDPKALEKLDRGLDEPRPDESDRHQPESVPPPAATKTVISAPTPEPVPSPGSTLKRALWLLSVSLLLIGVGACVSTA